MPSPATDTAPADATRATSQPTDRTGAAPTAPGGSGRWRRLRSLLVAVAGCWLVSYGAVALHVGWVLPALILLVAGAVLTSGETVLDRLVLAGALLFGVTCGGALLLSVWPWHLAPVAVGGTALTGLTAIAVLTGRRPRLPGRFRLADLLVVAGTVAGGLFVLWPFRTMDLADRISLMAPNDDYARHFVMYDAIQNAGGYLFLRYDVAEPFLTRGYGMVNYPTGSHLVFAVLDNFFRSRAGGNTGLSSFDHFLWLNVAAFIALMGCVLWAARWVSGPAAKGWAAVAALVPVGAYLVLGDPLAILVRGFTSEIAGLAMLAVLFAVLVRPLSDRREQLLLIGALLVGLSYSYFFLVPLALLATLFWFLAYRQVTLRSPLVLATAAVTVAASAVPIYRNVTYVPPDVLLLFGGSVIEVNRKVLGALVLVALVALVLVRRQSDPAWRCALGGLLGAVGFAAAIWVYQEVRLGGSTYYYEKSLHQLEVIAAVCLAALAPALARLTTRATARWVAPVAALAVVATAVVGLGAKTTLAGWPEEAQKPLGKQQVAFRYIRGLTGHSRVGGLTLFALKTASEPAGKVTVVQLSGLGNNYDATLFTTVIQRNYRLGSGVYSYMAPFKEPPREAADIIEYTERTGIPLRVITNNLTMYVELSNWATIHPEDKLEVINVSGQA